MNSRFQVRAALASGMAVLCSIPFAPAPARAFCGFYIAGADSSLYANATMVVLMREGTKTVLSMQNNYQGPPEEFALVIPVPTVLTKEQVKVLPHEVFDHVDSLGAPRLVEYWELDPCAPDACYDCLDDRAADAAQSEEVDEDGVTVEAMFTVGEYDVVVLSAEDSTGLNTWLRDNDYNIPDGAQPILAPYVAAGTKFFVAKVDPSRVEFKGNQAVLSPLRFHYDSRDFSLPVRLGLLNSQGTQDLIINILAKDRYELANYENATIPTNIRVHEEVQSSFGAFYESLFSEVLRKNPDAVVTEYSWDASTCDPCPTPPLQPSDLATLGADVIDGQNSAEYVPSYTLTRLHARYTRDSLGDDLVFKKASPITGGRGAPNTEGNLEQTVDDTSYNNFQGRYVILHPWAKDLNCQQPSRGHWGGPEGDEQPATQGSSNGALRGAVPEAVQLPSLVAESLPEIDVDADDPLSPFELRGASQTGGDSGSSADDDGEGCSCRLGRGKATPPAWGVVCGLGGLAAWLRRRPGQRRRASAARRGG